MISAPVLRGEAFGAKWAGERPLPGVRPLMLYEVTALNESSATHRAVVGFLCSVLESVPPQATKLGIADPTVWAGVGLLTGVDPLMHHHVCLLCEAFPAHRAAVPFFTQVCVHVVRQLGRRRKLPPTY